MLKNLVRRALNRFGIDIQRYHSMGPEMAQLETMLRVRNIDVVFDIGANSGQFAQGLRASGYLGRIVSFEPMSGAHAELLRRSRADPAWTIAPRVAIGDHEGEIDINISGNSVSSSALEMLDLHVKAAPGSEYVGKERVKMMRLDALAGGYVRNLEATFLKIDTQGFEDRVLTGAGAFLEVVRGLKIELSLVPLYGEQMLCSEMIDQLRHAGFSLWSVYPGMCDPISCRMLQVDAVLFRD